MSSDWRERVELGQGRYGVVYSCVRATDPPDADPIHALKRLRRGIPDTGELRKRFAREVEILLRLEHPNVMPVVDHDTTGAEPYLVMPRAEESLRDAIERMSMTRDRAVQIFQGILAGVSHAHGHNVLHRDLKPRNILLFAGVPKVSDFGIAKQLDLDGTTLTLSKQEMGTLRYMAPEQMADAKRAGPPADVYALGKIFAHMLTGQAPAPMRVELQGVPPEFRFFIDKCCREDATARYATAAEALAAFKQTLAADGIVAPPVERARELVSEARDAVGRSYEDKVIAGLDTHFRAHPDEREMYRSVLPSVKRSVLRAWSAHHPAGLRETIRTFDGHVAESGGLAFSYCDTVADFYIRVLDVTDDIEIDRTVVTRLLDLGYSHNRFYVHDIVVDLLSQIHAPARVAVAEEAIRDNKAAASWYADAALGRSLQARIATALREAQAT